VLRGVMLVKCKHRRSRRGATWTFTGLWPLGTLSTLFGVLALLSFSACQRCIVSDIAAVLGSSASLCSRSFRLCQQRKAVAAGCSATQDVELLPLIREGVVAAGGEIAWTESAKLLADAMVVSIEEAELHLAQTLGWKMWAACNQAQYLKPSLPNVAQLQATLRWLSEGPLALGPEQLHAAVITSPKVYLGNAEKMFNAARAAAPAEFSSVQDFTALALKRPRALEFTFDCGTNGCAQRCDFCWRHAPPSITRLAKKSG